MKEYLKNVNVWRVWAWVLGGYITIAAYSNGVWPAIWAALMYYALISTGQFIAERDAEIAQQDETNNVQ